LNEFLVHNRWMLRSDDERQETDMAANRLRTPERLADLISAIQVLGTYKFAVRRVSRWEKRLQRVPLSANSWSAVFGQHPEFFTFVREQGQLAPDPAVALIWRRSKERNYDTVRQLDLERDEAKALHEAEPEVDAERLSRRPLNADEISLLVQLALDLHERELKHQQERRWWYAVVIGIAGIMAGVFAR
jgi:hypothetical protein